jgi:UDPglucose 6-dehydrogenase
MPEAARALGEQPGLSMATDAYAAARQADGIVIATEWNEFRGLDLSLLRQVVRQPVIFDLRNVLEPVRAAHLGFDYYGSGRRVPDCRDVLPAMSHAAGG